VAWLGIRSAHGEHLVDPATRLKRIPVEVAAPVGPGENLEKFPVERHGEDLWIILPGGTPGL
jgi:hypothetical protein